MLKPTKIVKSKNMDKDSLTNLDQINKDLFDVYCSTCKDYFKETLNELGLKEPLRRLHLIGKLKYSDRTEIKKYHDEMIQSIESMAMEPFSKPSGLMVIDKSFFYHIVEGPDEVLNEVIECTAICVSINLLHQAKVIRTSSVAFRYFDNWNSCIILSPGYVDTSFEQSVIVKESNVPTLAHMIKKFEDIVFVLASYVRYLKETDFEEKINDLIPTSILPFENELETLYSEPFFLTVQKYVEKYLKPQNYISYLDQEWPPSGPAHDPSDFFEELEIFEKSIDETLKIEEDQKKRKARHGAWWWSQ